MRRRWMVLGIIGLLVAGSACLLWNVYSSQTPKNHALVGTGSGILLDLNGKDAAYLSLKNGGVIHAPGRDMHLGEKIRQPDMLSPSEVKKNAMDFGIVQGGPWVGSDRAVRLEGVDPGPYAQRDLAPLLRDKGMSPLGLEPGTLFLIQTLEGKYCLIQVTARDLSKGTLDIRWVYQPDGSAWFPKAAMPPFAAESPTEALWRLFRNSGGFDAEKKNRIRELVRQGADLNSINGDHRSFLHTLAGNGDLNSVKFWLELGADPNVHGGQGVTPLVDAVNFTRPEVCQLLLNKGADAQASFGTSGMTVLENALLRQRNESGEKDAVIAIIKMLLAHGAKPTRLPSAVDLGDVAAVKRLIADKSPLDDADSRGWTALGRAADMGNLDMIQVLLGAGANPRLGTRYLVANDSIVSRAASPLELAAARGHTAVVELFLNRQPDPQDAIAAMRVAQTQARTDVFRLLRDKWALTWTDERGHSALVVSIQTEYRDGITKHLVAKMLLDAGVPWKGPQPAEDLELSADMKDLLRQYGLLKQ